MRLSVSLAVSCLIATSLSAVEPAQASMRRPMNIPAQSLSTALQTFARERNLQIVFASDEVSSRSTSGAIGELTDAEALSRLLSGTGLSYRFLDEKTITVVPTSAAPAAAPVAPTTASPTPPTSRAEDAVENDEIDARPSGLWDRIRFALAADASPAHGDSVGSRVGASDSASTAKDKTDDLEEVVVASRLPGASTEGAVPVEVYERKRIRNSGAATVVDFLNTLPEVSIQTTTTGQYQHANGATTVQLRGLPVGTTLVMLNGRRVAGSGSSGSDNFFDLNSIPVAAIERIEVLPTGSSAVYGGDALGGIVNIVLRKGLEGLELDARFGSTSDGAYDEHQFALAGGWKGERWSGSAVAMYTKNSELKGSERPFLDSQDYRAYGGSDFRYPYGNPGNVCAVSGTLNGVGTRCAVVPTDSNGVGLTPADFASTAGQSNLASLSSYYSFLAPAEKYGAFVTSTFRLTDTAEVFAELMYNHLSMQMYVYPPLSTFAVPASAPNNPFGQNVTVGYLFEGLDRICGQCQETDYVRPLLGVRGSFGNSWQWETAAWESKDSARVNNGFQPANTAAINAAIASGALNLFIDGQGAASDLQSTFFTTNPVKRKGSLQAGQAFVRGPLADLWAGSLGAVFGVEYQKNRLAFIDDGGGPTANFDVHRNISAAFTELKLPLWGGGKRRGGADVLALQGAARYDDYSDFGSRFSYGSGIEYRPTDTVLIRGSYSTAFKPPTLYQLYGPTITFVGQVLDPLRGNELATPINAYGGNPSLQAETGSSSNFGVVWSPDAIANLDLTASQWNAHLNNGFVSVGANVILAAPDLFPGRVQRAPVEPGDPYGVGKITYIDQSFANFGHVKESGVDFSANWRKSTAFGEFAPALTATYVYRYDFEFTPGAGEENAVSQANEQSSYAPRWKGVAALNWSYSDASLGITGRYTGPYRDVTSVRPDPRMLGNFWYVDVNGSADLGRLFNANLAFGSKLSLTAGVRNLLGKMPVYSDWGLGFSGYDPNLYDLVGRYWWTQVSLSL